MTSFRRRWPNAAGVVSAGPPGGGVVHTSLTASVTDARSRAGRCLPVEGSGRQGSDVPAVTQRLRLVALPVESLAYVTAHISLVRVNEGDCLALPRRDWLGLPYMSGRP